MVYVICAIYVIFVIFGSFLSNMAKMEHMTYDHMTVIYMLIWVLIEASGSQECSPAFETRLKYIFKEKKGKT